MTIIDTIDSIHVRFLTSCKIVLKTSLTSTEVLLYLKQQERVHSKLGHFSRSIRHTIERLGGSRPFHNEVHSAVGSMATQSSHEAAKTI